MNATLSRRLHALGSTFTHQRGRTFALACGMGEWRYPQFGGQPELWLALNDEPCPVWRRVPAGREAEVRRDMTVAQARVLLGGAS